MNTQIFNDFKSLLLTFDIRDPQNLQLIIVTALGRQEYAKDIVKAIMWLGKNKEFENETKEILKKLKNESLKFKQAIGDNTTNIINTNINNTNNNNTNNNKNTNINNNTNKNKKAVYLNKNEELIIPPAFNFFCLSKRENYLKNNKIFYTENMKNLINKKVLKEEKKFFTENINENLEISDFDEHLLLNNTTNIINNTNTNNSINSINNSKRVKKNLWDVLYTGILCDQCSLRTTTEDSMLSHLADHSRFNKALIDNQYISREFYSTQEKFLVQEDFLELPDFDDNDSSEKVFVENKIVFCEICKERIETLYDENKEKWYMKEGVKLNEKEFCHIKCVS